MNTAALAVTGLIVILALVIGLARLHARIDALTKRLDLLEDKVEKLTIYLSEHTLSTEHPWGSVIQYGPPQRGQPRSYRFPPLDEQR